MRDVPCQCNWWLCLARVNSREGGKGWEPLTALEFQKHENISPRIRAFHSLSAHILQILLTPPLKYIQTRTTFNHLHHWFWFDSIWFDFSNLIISYCRWEMTKQYFGNLFTYLGHHRKAVLPPRSEPQFYWTETHYQCPTI